VSPLKAGCEADEEDIENDGDKEEDEAAAATIPNIVTNK